MKRSPEERIRLHNARRVGTARRRDRAGVGPRALNKVLVTLVAIPLLAAAAACSNKPPDDPKAYAAEIASARAAKDAAYAGWSDPVPQNRHAELLPLAYFPIDPAYDVPASLKPASDATELDMPTSTGTQRKMRRVGALEFTLKGQPLKLTAFVEVGAKDLDHLFVPFTDLTTGTETYAVGRYLDLDRTPSGVYAIDFNRAYQPYCYYNPTYECPYPPAENRLKVPIRAGEKLKSTR
jgi:uncharacterized protein (DUF1684 family)